MIVITDQNKIDELKLLYQLYGGEWGKYNLGGIQNSEKVNEWDDIIFRATDKDIWLFQGTTEPGATAMNKHSQGANHLQLGFWKDLWKLEYGSKYGMDVFKQVGKVNTWNDTNRNFKHDPSDTITNDAGPSMACWMHSTKKTDLSYVNDSGWMCQVLKYWKEFSKLTEDAKKSGETLFSYMLFSLKNDTKFLYKEVFGNG